MLNRNLNVLPVVLLLAGCGGGDFSTEAALDGTGGAAGTVEADAGTGGAAGATQGTGGVTGVTGGQSGVTGGSAGAGGDPGGTGGGSSGGQPAGSGGDPGGNGGAATGGQPADAGAGGAGTCKPPRLMPENLPQTVVWTSYLGKSPNYQARYDVCVTCQQSPCTTCSIAWWPVDQSADGITVTAKATLSGCTPIPVNMGACANDLTTSSCTTWNADNFSTTFTFQLLPNAGGTGYRAVYRTSSGTGGISQPQGSCAFDPRAYDEAVGAGPYLSLMLTMQNDLLAMQWPCGA